MNEIDQKFIETTEAKLRDHVTMFFDLQLMNALRDAYNAGLERGMEHALPDFQTYFPGVTTWADLILACEKRDEQIEGLMREVSRLQSELVALQRWAA